MGYGLGVGSSVVIGAPHEIWSSHNNYLHLLLQLGVFGFIAYFLIYLIFLMDVYISNIEKSIKYFYYGLIISIALMNFTGDVNVYGVGISQQFWMVIGFWYVFRGSSATSPHSV